MVPPFHDSLILNVFPAENNQLSTKQKTSSYIRSIKLFPNNLHTMNLTEPDRPAFTTTSELTYTKMQMIWVKFSKRNDQILPSYLIENNYSVPILAGNETKNKRSDAWKIKLNSISIISKKKTKK